MMLEEMVGRVSWFAKVDYPIFSFFEDHDIQVSPKVLAENIGYDPDYVGRRLRTMRDAGLVQQNETGLYELTESGRSLLEGEISNEEIEEMNPENR